MLQAFIERAAGDEFRHQEVGTIFGIEVEDGRHVGMVQAREGQRFAAKPLAGSFVGQHAGGQNFDRDLALEALVVGEIDDAHPAGSNLFADAVVAYGLADHGEGGGPRMVFGGLGLVNCGGIRRVRFRGKRAKRALMFRTERETTRDSPESLPPNCRALGMTT